MRDEIKTVLLTEDEIDLKVRELGKKITSDYNGKELLMVGILKGSVMFISELMKRVDGLCEIDFMDVSTYGNASETSGNVKILKDLDHSIEGKNILIVEDIIDTGITLEYLLKYFRNKNAKSVEIATLLSKPERRKADINVKYIGFKVPDEFLVGYGLDYAEKFRNLPYIGILKREVYSK